MKLLYRARHRAVQPRTTGHRVGIILPMAVAFTLLVAGIAGADLITNTIDTSVDPAMETVTINAGGSATVGFKVIASNTPTGDASGCNATGSSPATMTLSVPSAVTASSSSVMFVGCDNPQNVVFSSTTPGAYMISVASVTGGKAGSLWNTLPASFTLVVNASDTTPPVITANVSGALGNNGWYTSDVTLTWNVADPESAITSSAGCDPTFIGSDTAGQTLTCTATSAGGSSSQSATIKRDATPPTVNASASPAPNGYGWNNSPVTVSFSGNDTLSGLDVCDGPAVLTGEGSGQSATGSCTDKAGNSAAATASSINIDLTAPNVTLVGGPMNGATYYYGFVPAAPTCSAGDALSGLDGDCAVSGYNGALGTHTVKATAQDKAGNEEAAEATYTVAAWTLTGFYSPVEMGSTVLNTVKGGSTVPLKFEVFAGMTELTDPALVSMSARLIACPGGSEDPVDVDMLSAGSTSLRYDTESGQFIQNWKTPKAPGKCYEVKMTASDGSTLVANFKLK